MQQLKMMSQRRRANFSTVRKTGTSASCMSEPTSHAAVHPDIAPACLPADSPGSDGGRSFRQMPHHRRHKIAHAHLGSDLKVHGSWASPSSGNCDEGRRCRSAHCSEPRQSPAMRPCRFWSWCGGTEPPVHTELAEQAAAGVAAAVAAFAPRSSGGSVSAPSSSSTPHCRFGLDSPAPLAWCCRPRGCG